MQSAQPFIVDVRSSAGFEQGDTFYYLAMRPGDSYVIRTWAALPKADDTSAKVEATDDVVLTIAGERVEPVVTHP